MRGSILSRQVNRERGARSHGRIDVDAPTVRYRGIHCFGKSEAVDEPYAIVGVYTPDSPETTITKKFPIGAASYENFVASTDTSESVDVRTLTTPQDLAISCTVMEDRKSTRLNSSHVSQSRMPSSA